MEKVRKDTPVWRIWVDNQNRIISFHEEKDSCLMEFRDREMFFRCVDQYTGRQYRYQ